MGEGDNGCMQPPATGHASKLVVHKVVQGWRGRFNTVLYLPGSTPRCEARRAAVLFPGDVSDLAAEMTENHEYSLEEMASRVRTRVPPQDDLLVIRPAVSAHGFFSHYTYFLGGMGHYMHPRDEQVVPRDDTTACQHMAALLHSLKQMEQVRFASVSLVGFSKGCQVVRRMIESPNTVLWRSVASVYLVDAGLHHAGAYPAAGAVQSLLDASAQRAEGPFTIHVSATARQLSDSSRPWIKEEYDLLPCTSRTELPGATMADHFDCVYNLSWKD